MSSAQTAPVVRRLHPGAAALAAVGNIVFMPVRVALAAVGGVLGGLTGWLTAGNEHAAHDIWRCRLDGQTYLQPEMMYGEEPLSTIGRAADLMCTARSAFTLSVQRPAPDAYARAGTRTQALNAERAAGRSAWHPRQRRLRPAGDCASPTSPSSAAASSAARSRARWRCAAPAASSSSSAASPAREASGAAAGVLAVASSRAPRGVLFELKRASAALFPALAAELREETGIDVEYSTAGLLDLAFTSRDAEQLDRLVARRREQGFAVELLDADSVRARHPEVNPAVRRGAWFADDRVDQQHAPGRGAARVGARARRGVPHRRAR